MIKIQIILSTFNLQFAISSLQCAIWCRIKMMWHLNVVTQNLLVDILIKRIKSDSLIHHTYIFLLKTKLMYFSVYFEQIKKRSKKFLLTYSVHRNKFIEFSNHKMKKNVAFYKYFFSYFWYLLKKKGIEKKISISSINQRIPQVLYCLSDSFTDLWERFEKFRCLKEFSERV